MADNNGKEYPIKTVVLLVMENRSFDHMLGWMKSLNPEIDGLTGQESNPLNTSDPNSGHIKFGDGSVFVDPNPGHSYQDIYEQVYGEPWSQESVDKKLPPTMQGFAQNANRIQNGMAETVMNGFKPELVPVYKELVTQFAVCDRWFASMPASTQPNRLYVHSATSHGLIGNDSKKLNAGMPQKTIFDSLHDAGHSFGIYYQSAPSTLYYKNLRKLKYASKFHPFDVTFKLHCKEGKLPNYVVIEPRYFDLLALPGNDDHPSHDVSTGQKFVKEVYEALRSSPQWNEMLFMVVYDEHGGFYDHVPTPVKGVPNPDDLVGPGPYNFKFDRLGVRVPAMFISPWIEPGTVLHTPSGPQPTSQYEHSSIPATIKTGFTAKHDRNDNKTEKDDTEHKLLDEACADLVYNPASYETLVSESNDNVWGLIPSIKKKLHDHQKKAFEFLWRNLAGSLIPSEMEPSSKKVGGCVISHAPGAGKTFLIIAFLVSYLKLFPGKRPLVLAPKTTLYTWYKEIIKWEFPVPVYQIHGRRTYRDRIYMQKVGTASSSLVPNGDIMHVLDCLEKIQKWHAHPSVLLMGYTSFLSLMREDSKYAHRRYMGQILRESPGILILDEGHNPRSTKSRLRKALMRVDTEFRILLSGTLFQNNFGEYFNTLCLARPKFVDEVLRVLDPKYKKKIKGQNKTRTSIENRARKVFMDIIARKINSSETEERADGLNMLKNMTNKFIDVYEGGGSENLPGLQSYTLMMKPTPLQHEILVRLHKHMNVARGFPLELELMITLGSIHPWLIKSAVCANKFLSLEELQSLDEFRLDPTKGSKVKFVLGLVQRSIIRREKVLIFCHNIAPINLFLELFERIYGWKKGHEVLVLQGDLELFERGRVMDKFEERGGPSKVLLASINACAEGITLTAASRVVLLDSEWNPSKQKQAIARAFRPGQEKIVYVYQLLVNGTLEEDKHGRTTWKEWVSCMIFSEEHVDDPSKWQAEKIEDALLREIVEEDHAKSFHMIMKNERASYENPLKVITEE